ncbi:MAG: hypothetical protein NC911_03130 [Candidatus Omnitrophica bacterium]|nr:hypothetical protein [Candidatus Omnitrophota bacterium]
MNSRNVTFSTFLLIILLVSHLAYPAESAIPWWNDAWRFRSRLKILTAGLNTRIETAVFPFTLTEDTRKDLSDLRIVTAEGEPLPLFAERNQDGSIFVYFPVKACPTDYYLYYGNPLAETPEVSYSPRFFPLSLETRRKNFRTHPRSLTEMVKLFQSSGNIYGHGRRRKIDDLENPFGPNTHFVGLYQGYLFCPENGLYFLATNSDDGSFLLIDEQLVASWPGSHEKEAGANRPLENRWSHWGQIYLQSGLHKIEYYHEQGGGACLARVGWRKPGDQSFSVIPEEYFLPCLKAALANREERGKSLTSFFTAEILENVLFTGWPRPLLKVRFQEAITPANQPTSRHWQFPDGFISEQRMVVWVVEEKKPFSVSLTVKDSQGNTSRCQQTFCFQKSSAPVRFDFTLGYKPLPYLVSSPVDLPVWITSYSDTGLELTSVWSIQDSTGKTITRSQETFFLKPEDTQTLPWPAGPLPKESQRTISIRYGQVNLATSKLVFLSPDSDLSHLEIRNDQLYQRGKRVLLRLSTFHTNREKSGLLPTLKPAETNRISLAVIGSPLSLPEQTSWASLLPEQIKKLKPHLRIHYRFYPTDDKLNLPSFVQAVTWLHQATYPKADLVILLPGVNEQIFPYWPNEFSAGLRFLTQALKHQGSVPVLAIPPALPQREKQAYPLALQMKEVALRESIAQVDFFSLFRFSSKEKPGRFSYRYSEELNQINIAKLCTRLLLTDEKTRDLLR